MRREQLSDALAGNESLERIEEAGIADEGQPGPTRRTDQHADQRPPTTHRQRGGPIAWTRGQIWPPPQWQTERRECSRRAVLPIAKDGTTDARSPETVAIVKHEFTAVDLDHAGIRHRHRVPSHPSGLQPCRIRLSLPVTPVPRRSVADPIRAVSVAVVAAMAIAEPHLVTVLRPEYRRPCVGLERV